MTKDRLTTAFAFALGVAASLAVLGLLSYFNTPEAKTASHRKVVALKANEAAPKEVFQAVRPRKTTEPVRLEPESHEDEEEPSDRAAPEEEVTPADSIRDDLAAHSRDWRDAGWASAAEASLSKTYSEIPGSHKVRTVDCRTSSCVVEVEWPSFSEATAGYRSLLAAPTEPNCESKILLRPSGEEGVYSERLVLDCAGARTGISD